MPELSQLLKSLQLTFCRDDEARNQVIVLVELVKKMLPIVDEAGGVTPTEFRRLWPAEHARWMKDWEDDDEHESLFIVDARKVSKAARAVLALIAKK